MVLKMKRIKKYMVIVALMGIPVIFGSTAANATLLFSDDFEGDLLAWTGKYGGPHSGEIVADPLDLTNQVLHFTNVASGGDMYTIETFTSQVDVFRLEFDYLGDLSQGGDPGDLGGFVGITSVDPGTGTYNSGTADWLAGTQDNYPYPRLELPDTGQWLHIRLFFESTVPVHLMLEDFYRSNGGNAIAGDAYFDNVELHNPYPHEELEDSANPTPEPGTMLLFGSGMLGLAGLAKRRKKK
jgi:hypothetical protein